MHTNQIKKQIKSHLEVKSNHEGNTITWKKAFSLKRRNPTHTNVQKFQKAQKELTKIYQKEQLEYIQSQINEIKNSVDDKQSHFVWQTVNEISRRKSTLRSKLKVASQEEKLQDWKEHFKNLHRNPPEITDHQSKEIIYDQEAINTDNSWRMNWTHFWKAAGLDEIPPEV